MCNPAHVRTSLVFVSLAAVSILSCKASFNVDVNAAQKEQSEDPFGEVLEAPKMAPSIEQTEFFGIARRMVLRPGDRTATCQCVAAVVGNGNEADFAWYGEKPAIGPDALAVAITADGIPCERKGRGPSIAAIDRDGQDVVVVLEEFKDTRPIALGAIIPNPGQGGTVFLTSRGNAPYGRPLPGQGSRNLCRIGQGSLWNAEPEP